jgi:hypothetical protein
MEFVVYSVTFPNSAVVGYLLPSSKLNFNSEDGGSTVLRNVVL